jgi:preprotein translocase subunit SecY
MSLFDTIIENLPEVKGPTQKKLTFKQKLKWTLAILVLFYILGHIPLYGLGKNSLSQFEYLSIILGASFGSIISLGIGPLVTASIVMQLLNGSGIIKFDLTTSEGKKRFQGIQKLVSYFFILFEAAIYVFMGGLAPAQELIGTSFYTRLEFALIIQLFIGGMLVMFMDEVISKWGFGSGISLFIAAGVSQKVFLRAFNPLSSPTNPNISSGAIPALFQSLSAGDPVTAGLMLASVLSTIFVFLMAVYGQAMKIEIPLSFGNVRGYGMKWPLSFIYTSNIPVILVAALMANIQLWGRLLQNWLGHPTWLGGFSGNQAISGFAVYVNPPRLLQAIIKGSVSAVDFGHALVYMLILIGGSVIFSLFWVQTSGMDAKSQAKQIMASGLQIPGFRKDQRILENVLNRYIWPLTVMGGATVGLLAAVADITGALGSGTGLLLTVMIIYKLYEEIARDHMMDMNPAMKKFLK